MRVRTGRWGWLLALGLVLAPAAAYGQEIGQANENYEVPPPDPVLPLPLGGPRYEEGGLYFAGEFLFFHQTNPLGSQPVAFRGFTDSDGRITGTPGTFVGSHTEALNVNDLGGPNTYQPGFSVNLGWRFKDGATFEIDWWHLFDAKYSATASLIPQNFAVGPQTADSFLFSPVYNFPIQYGGPDVRLKDLNGNPAFGTTFGIWNGASLETIEFIQRFDKFDIGGRIPVYDTDCWRTYALLGARALIMWERFKWRTVAADINGVSTNIDEAFYSNITSNRLYGPHMGCGNEWYLGSNPLGALSILLNLDGALCLDFVKERARYELGDRSTAATRSRNVYTFAPEVEATLGFVWYPTQAIQVRLTWDFLGVFNTMASPEPIDFNYGAIDPTWTHEVIRILTGVRAGIGFVF
jgi:hypothetical protein